MPILDEEEKHQDEVQDEEHHGGGSSPVLASTVDLQQDHGRSGNEERSSVQSQGQEGEGNDDASTSSSSNSNIAIPTFNAGMILEQSPDDIGRAVAGEHPQSASTTDQDAARSRRLHLIEVLQQAIALVDEDQEDGGDVSLAYYPRRNSFGGGGGFFPPQWNLGGGGGGLNKQL